MTMFKEGCKICSGHIDCNKTMPDQRESAAVQQHVF